MGYSTAFMQGKQNMIKVRHVWLLWNEAAVAYPGFCAYVVR